jgi:hypothetical protein
MGWLNEAQKYKFTREVFYKQRTREDRISQYIKPIQRELNKKKSHTKTKPNKTEKEKKK